MISTTDTFDPSRLGMFSARSRPMYPAPMTSMDFGTLSRASAPSESITHGEPLGRTGSQVEEEPVAMMPCSKEISSVPGVSS